MLRNVRAATPKPSGVTAIRMASDHADETIVSEPDPLGEITAFAVDPQDSRTLYVAGVKGSTAGLFFSHDPGNSWERKSSLEKAPRHFRILPIEIACT
ncbi:MAG: hypothetical protein JO033_23790 [Acidobacteriaceae bacterium]|nr:hypothetical protein [Acidobacteriaceae bacterium]MBV9502706.1 hypothetical protein [Acidobacteriaceae bacterium]